MEGAQRGAVLYRCSGTVDNLLIGRMVTLDCHKRKRNLSMGWVDVQKAWRYRPWLARGDDAYAQVPHLVVYGFPEFVKKLEYQNSDHHKKGERSLGQYTI